MNLYLKKQLKDLKIFYKMLFICVAVTILISLLSGGITYYIASDIIKKKTVAQTSETIRQLSENCDSFMEIINNRIDYMAYNPTVQEELIYGEPGEEERGYYSGTRKVKRLMVQMFKSTQMEDIEIYGANGKLYFCSIRGTDEPVLANEQELKQIAEDNAGAIMWVNDIETSGCMQVVKEIKDNLSMRSLGILRTSIRLSALERIQKNVDFASSGRTLLLDDRNHLILGGETELTEKVDELFTNWNDSFQYTIDGKVYQVVYVVSEYTGWKTIGILPDKVITDSIIPLQLATMIAIAAGIILSLFLSVFMSRFMGRPISNTVNALRQVSKGDFSVRLESDRQDEFGELNQEFNYTINRMETLLEEITQSRILNKEMEFKALQAQINPHFLYNALDTVNWMARKQGQDDICEMISAVSNLLRISISNKEAMFTIEKELRYVQDYLYIQQTRYRNRFEADFQIQDDIMHQRLPKLTLQPLVENAIVHSVEVSQKKTTLEVKGYRTGEEVIIEVTDTGVGMDERTLEKLLKPSKEKTVINTAHTGLGIYAVHQRLQYLYGERYGLTVTSRLKEGTKIVIRIPFQADEEETLVRAAKLVGRSVEDGTEGVDS